MKADQQADFVWRLHCAAGHLNAVIEMSEDGQSCEKVLHQLIAVQAALQAAGLRLLKLHAHQSEATILASSSPVQRAAELRKLQSLYAILMQNSARYNEVIK